MARRRQLVVFKVGHEEFAIDILLTREVVVPREITPVPETAEYVEGVMNLRGNLVPVLDFRCRLRAGKAGDHDERRIIITSLDGQAAGLIVDGASEVIRVGEEMIEPAPDIISEMGADYIAGVINLGERFVTLVDLKKALTEEIKCELDEVIALLVKHSARGTAPVKAAQG
jgi:purine-binding chemotaxis protein CheW